MTFLRLRRTESRNGNLKSPPGETQPSAPRRAHPAAEPLGTDKGRYPPGRGTDRSRIPLRRACPSARAAGRTLHPARPKAPRREARDLHDPTSLPCLIYFAQATLTSFRLQGVDPPGDQAGVSALLPPVPFVPTSGRG